jgi:hypothetical protein
MPITRSMPAWNGVRLVESMPQMPANMHWRVGFFSGIFRHVINFVQTVAPYSLRLFPAVGSNLVVEVTAAPGSWTPTPARLEFPIRGDRWPDRQPGGLRAQGPLDETTG